MGRLSPVLEGLHPVPRSPGVWCAPALLDPDERRRAIGLGEARRHGPGSVGGTGARSAVVPQTRRARVGWIDRAEPHATWLFERVDTLVRTVNRQSFRYALDWAGREALQYSHYGAHDAGHYDWHQDLSPGADPAWAVRKVSVVVVLACPPPAHGGQLFLVGCELPAGHLAPGDALCFPSYVPHRVTPVRAGERHTLVTWYEGPPWR